MNYKTIHRITGILISIFIIAHLFNHLMAWFSIQTHREIMALFRIVYRQPILEVVLIASFLFQAYSGISLVRALRKKPYLTIPERIQYYSGITLGLFFIQHILAVVGQRLYYQFDTNFYFAARVVLDYPLNLFFVPYYFVGIVAFGVHVGSAHHRKISRSMSLRIANSHFIIIVFISILIACTILYTFMGGRYSISIPQQYEVY